MTLYEYYKKQIKLIWPKPNIHNQLCKEYLQVLMVWAALALLWTQNKLLRYYRWESNSKCKRRHCDPEYKLQLINETKIIQNLISLLDKHGRVSAVLIDYRSVYDYKRLL